jgi:hypothetical protein
VILGHGFLTNKHRAERSAGIFTPESILCNGKSAILREYPGYMSADS